MMWRERRYASATWLMLLIAVLLGFCGGYLLLPRTGLAHLLNTGETLLPASLPFATALAAETPPDGSVTPAAPELLLQASLPAAAALELPREQARPDEGLADQVPAPTVAGDMADAPSILPAKAEPRLILMEEASITAYAALTAQAAPLTLDAPLIAVYCTHSSEEYRGEARVPGGRGGVHTVAQKLTESLNALGLPSVYCDTVHDYPDWDLSYASSLASIQQLQAQYPSLQVFIDVHRDSQAPSVLATASGNIARMMLVVGSNARLAHPNWKKNQAFAEQIQKALEARVPNVTRGVNVQQGRYNQHISDQAILVEMGSTANTTAEACASAELLAQALAAVLK